MKDKVMQHNIRNCAVLWQISLSKKALHIFALAFIIFQILAFKMFYLENLGEDRGVQHSQ